MYVSFYCFKQKRKLALPLPPRVPNHSCCWVRHWTQRCCVPDKKYIQQYRWVDAKHIIAIGIEIDRNHMSVMFDIPVSQVHWSILILRENGPQQSKYPLLILPQQHCRSSCIHKSCIFVGVAPIAPQHAISHHLCTERLFVRINTLKSTVKLPDLSFIVLLAGHFSSSC